MNWTYFSFGHDLTENVLPSKRKDAIEAIYCNEFKVRLEFQCGGREWYKCINTHRLLNATTKTNLLTAINELIAYQLKDACVESYSICAKKCLIDFPNEYVVFSVFAY